MSKPRVVTLGCRLNNAESDAMLAMATQEGLENAIIVNTCAVTAEAERQARQTIRHLRKENPEAYIVATGCAVQLRPEIFAGMKEIDRVIGNHEKALRESFSREVPYRVHVEKTPSSLSQLEVPAIIPGKAKAFVQVQNGCNHFCTFCTIPLARGRSRSIPMKTIVTHIEQLLLQGIKEIVLTGVDLTSYEDELPLGQMIRKLFQMLPELKRLRLSSLDSIEVHEELKELLVDDPRMLPHIHLSLQSGSNCILSSMKRRHNREQAIELCTYLRKRRPELAMGADFIVGFPGETREMFQETLALVDECDLAHLHVFPFSRRPGTLASRMSDQVDPSEIKERALILREKGKEKLSCWLDAQLGSLITLLAEQPQKGHADDFSYVHLTKPIEPNTVITARVVASTSTHLLALPEAHLPGDALQIDTSNSYFSSL